ncbi:MAG: helix-turn-helix domain-containing protein, partial [Candidatus Omnitrophica bacterium]|nr:helix-turn-helix domain-containing protein [Candidatus Omnitrophota bacterium]
FLHEQEKKSESFSGLKLGETLRRLRERQGLSGAELCRRSGGLDPRTLVAIEKGRIKNPSIESLQKLASGLGCLVKDIFAACEMELEQNYWIGSQKGAFQFEFPKAGLKIISATPFRAPFFCGKLILAPKGYVSADLLKSPFPVFLEIVLGKVEFTLEKQTLTLKEGENVFFDGGFGYALRNLLNRETVIGCVTASFSSPKSEA